MRSSASVYTVSRVKWIGPMSITELLNLAHLRAFVYFRTFS